MPLKLVCVFFQPCDLGVELGMIGFQTINEDRIVVELNLCS